MIDIVKDMRRLRKQRQERQRLDGQASATEGGCICPPRSEQTCKNPKCPRQDHRTLGEKMKVWNG